MWSLELPPKVKNLMLRAFLELLPTKELYLKKVTQDSMRPGCQSAGEDPLHALVTCPMVRKARDASTGPVRSRVINNEKLFFLGQEQTTNKLFFYFSIPHQMKQHSTSPKIMSLKKSG